MSDVHCFTTTCLSCLSHARVLGEGLRRHHPEWTLWLCIPDREPPGFTFELQREPFDHVLWAKELPVGNFRRWSFERELPELRAAVNALATEHIMNVGAATVIYLNRKAVVFSALDLVPELLDRRAIVLTPDRITDIPVRDSPRRVYEPGLLGLNRREIARIFSRTRRECLECLFSAVEYRSDASCFEHVHFLDDPAYNISTANLREHNMAVTRDGELRVDGQRLRLIVLPNLDVASELAIAAQGNSIGLELIWWYRRMLEHHVEPTIPAGWWAYGRYDDGSGIEASDRITYRSRPDLRAAFPNPFAVGRGSYLEWIRKSPVRGRPG